MKQSLSRREFLKLATVLPLGLLLPRTLTKSLPPDQGATRPNVIIIVFDALSAHNLSLYGYQRETMPNLSRLAERALIYHNHFAGGNFTTPATASLLTGVYPWTHRAFRFYGKVQEKLAQKSLFHAFEGYHRFAYSHNPLVVTLLEQFSSAIEQLIPQSRLMLTNDSLIQTLFKNDEDIATVGWTRTIKREDEFSYSLFLSHIYKRLKQKKVEKLQPEFPRGVPHYSDNYFLLEDGIDWLRDNLPLLPQPFCGYFHFYPPHAPYNTHREFYGRFEDDGWQPPEKPIDLFANRTAERTLDMRTQYDEFLLYVDREFGRLFAALETSGLLDNTWLIVTSDHGEMFERGIRGHLTPVLYQPVIHIPLLIFEPGRTSRLDIRTPTSAIDLLPTLLYLTGQPAASWTEGHILPPFADPAERNLYAVQARYSEPLRPLSEATLMLVQGDHKLVRFFGYKELGSSRERIELYNLRRDPEELDNLYPKEKELSRLLLAELQTAQEKADAPYRL